MIEPIYRDLELTRTSADKVGRMMQALIICGGSIVGTGYLTNGFADTSVTYWTTFYKLKFNSPEQLERFHQMGHKTEAPPKVTGNNLTDLILTPIE